VNHAKTYPTREASERSKRFLAGGLVAVLHEPCAGWHLEPAGKATAAPRKAQRSHPFPALVRDVLDMRDRLCCQRCAGTRDIHRHHRRPKGMGGSRDEHAQCTCNGLLACGPCHAWIHAHPRLAEAQGFIVSQSVQVPGSVGVMRFAESGGGATQWPTCDGEWAESAAEARETAA
jgi:5-methylcytosine-specific restriction enzyme A